MSTWHTQWKDKYVFFSHFHVLNVFSSFESIRISDFLLIHPKYPWMFKISTFSFVRIWNVMLCCPLTRHVSHVGCVNVKVVDTCKNCECLLHREISTSIFNVYLFARSRTTQAKMSNVNRYIQNTLKRSNNNAAPVDGDDSVNISVLIENIERVGQA